MPRSSEPVPAAWHTFTPLVRDDGADGQVIRWVTHAPPRTAFDNYTRAWWNQLCEELAKLRVDLSTARS